MKFSIGDRILLKRTGEEGEVVAFLSKTMMEVEVAGVRFPVYNEEVDHPYLKWFTEQKKSRPKASAPEVPVEKPASRPQRLARGIYLSFMPLYTPGVMEDIIEAFRIHLINESPDTILFSYQARTAGGATIFGHKATLHPFGHVYLHPLTLEEVNAQPRFHWEVAAAGAPGKSPLSGVLRIRPAQLIRHIQVMQESNNPAFSVLLAQDAEGTALPAKAVAGSGKARPDIGTALPSNPAPQLTLHTLPEAVLDLHMNPSETGQGPEDVLFEQLALLEQKLQAAMATGMPSMIVIHGIGNGTLRQKVHAVLAAMPGILSFSNHWMGAYGWGATEVIFGGS